MSKVKKVTALICALMMAGLVGCGNGTTPPAGESAAAESNGGTGDVSTDKPEASGDLIFWNVSYKTVDDNGVYETEDLIFNKTLAAFEEANNCKVEVVNQTYDNIPNLFKTAGLAQNGPDIAFMWAGGFTNDYKQFIEPLDSYYTEEELAAFPVLDLCRADFKPDGALLGIPTDVTTLNLFYNKAAFEKAGLPRDTEFKTMADLEAACQKLADANIQPFVMNDGGGYNSAWVVGEFLADKYGAEEIFGLMTGDAQATDEVFTAATNGWVDFCKKLVDNSWVNADAFTTTSDEVFVPMYTGEAAMRFGGSWDSETLFTELGEDVGTMPIPVLDANDPYADYIVGQIANNLVVSNYSKNKDLAVDFIKACTTQEYYVERSLQEGQLPARIDIDMNNSGIENELFKTCYEWFANNKNVVGFDSIMSADGSAEFYRQAPLMVAGSATVEEGLKEIQNKNDAAIAAAKDK